MKTYIKKRTLALSIFFISSVIFAGEVEDIITKHIKAHGGIENWENVKSLKITGTFTGFSIPSDFTTLKKKPGYYRSDYGLGKHDVIEATDGNTSWTLDPWSDIPLPRFINDAEENVIQQKAEMCTPFFNYQEKGHHVEYLGEEDIEGTKTLKLKLTRKNGLPEIWYLDAKTYLEFKLESRWQDFGYPSMQETFFDDFRKVGKITLPFYIERSFSIRNRITEIDNIEINPEIDNSEFAKPLSPAMKKLATMEGEWHLVVKGLTRRGWMKSDSTEANLKFLSNNNLLEGEISYENYYQKDNKFSWSYNSEIERYLLTVFNGISGNTMIFEGQLKNDTIEFSNKKVAFEQTNPETKRYRKYIITEIHENSFKMELASSRDQGKNWRVGEKLFFTRKE